MSELTDFLLARIAEDEALARTAGGGEWQTGPGADDVRVFANSGSGPCVAATVPLGYEIRRANAAHIATHDPARVLAECEAKRRIVAFMLDEHGATIDGEWGCCHSGDDFRNGGRAPEWEGEEFEPLPADCPGAKAAHDGLRLLALPYADHADYDEEWRP